MRCYFRFAIPVHNRFSSLDDEYIPSDPDDSDPHEDDMDSSKTPSTSRFQVMQKHDSELLNEAIAIAAEQRVDANDVVHSSYQVSSPTVSQFRQQRVSISHTAPSYDPLLFVQHQPLYPTQYVHLQGLPYPFSISRMNVIPPPPPHLNNMLFSHPLPFSLPSPFPTTLN